MTPQEELFAHFFNDEKGIVGEMDTLTLRAHREELAKIAFEARARLTAVDDEERARKAKARKESGPTGFSTSLTTDDVTSDAINAVKKRAARMSKMDKIKAGLAKLGIDTKDADSIMSAGTILGRVKGEAVANTAPVKIVNPFAKPAEPVAVATDVQINEETNTVVVKTEEVKPEEPKAFINPFAKKE